MKILMAAYGRAGEEALDCTGQRGAGIGGIPYFEELEGLAAPPPATGREEYLTAALIARLVMSLQPSSVQPTAAPVRRQSIDSCQAATCGLLLVRHDFPIDVA
ncbi:hypothetical protein T492DRAFT_893092 [Pavlovales sp. CCMP2436]|nr:hypothetical protein T492DRAFT_893092 [Pavlovales sp. CCMP2436]